MDHKPTRWPTIIQGGMGVAVSGWQMAHAVAAKGQMGVVSGTGLDTVLIRRLQLGDDGGHVREALAAFPFPDVAMRILDRYYIPGGKALDEPFKLLSLASERLSQRSQEVMIAANFVEVWLAKRGATGPVGINFLDKIRVAIPCSLYGAILAGVDCVLVGAGIPRAVPGLIDGLISGQPVEMKLDVTGASKDSNFVTRFDPAVLGPIESHPQLTRPMFLPIVASATLASVLVKKSTGQVDGFIIEEHTAGGHNAPPRGRTGMNDAGEPVYTERDRPDLQAIAALGLPFWLAGSYATPHRVREALSLGAAGVQVGTLFAYCEESGLDDGLKARVLAMSRDGEVCVHTDPAVSPTGFPFKVVQMEGTQSEAAVYEKRDRICDIGGLRTAYERPDGKIGWRCPGEPVKDYVRKGGDAADCEGRACLCNALMANIGLPQARADGEHEAPLVTSGDDAKHIARMLKGQRDTYSAADTVAYLLDEAGAT